MQRNAGQLRRAASGKRNNNQELKLNQNRNDKTDNCDKKMLTFIWSNLLQGLNDNPKESWLESW